MFGSTAEFKRRVVCGVVKEIRIYPKTFPILFSAMNKTYSFSVDNIVAQDLYYLWKNLPVYSIVLESEIDMDELFSRPSQNKL